MTVVKTPRRSEALPIRMPPGEISVPVPTPGSDAALLEADRRLRRFAKWWNASRYRTRKTPEGASNREENAWGNLAGNFYHFIGHSAAFTAAGVLVKFRWASELSCLVSNVRAGKVWKRTIIEALKRLADGRRA